MKICVGLNILMMVILEYLIGWSLHQGVANFIEKSVDSQVFTDQINIEETKKD